MPRLALVIANKNYSSWSLRAWLAMTEAGIPFAERRVKFDSPDWAANIAALSPTRLVPALWEGDPGAGFVTFDTLAILERLHELRPEAAIWPADAVARARARSLVADFHGGYQALRGTMPMNIRSSRPGKGMTPEARRDIERLTGHWRETRSRFGRGGPLLFGAFSAADAYFAPVASRFVTYDVSPDANARAYQQALLATPKAWTQAALQEAEFVAMDEPYAKRPLDLE